jgi:acetyl-CoA carboxylase biotin carboxyl carrier protein
MTEGSAGLFEVGHPTNGRHEDSAVVTLTTLCRSLADILRLVAPATPRRVNLRCGVASVQVEWWGDGATTVSADDHAVLTAAHGGSREPVKHQVLAPLLGTFYRRPEPGAKVFVNTGDLVEAGQQVGIVEAMKLMNPIEADQPGRIVEILVGDGEPVEYGQPLLVLEPVERR